MMRITAVLLAALSFAGFAAEPVVENNVVYGKADDVELKLNLARPEGDGPFPLIVCIHGGGWAAGNKNGYNGFLTELARRGYVAASVEYRFAPKYKFPCQVEDVKCAVRYLRSRAKELKIDKDKVGALGDSAGGHLSLMLGLMDAKDGLEGSSGHPEEPSKVQAVVNYYGPTDFSVETSNPLAFALVSQFLGTSDQKNPIAAQAAPITYVRASSPPILTFHGSKDMLVPLDQAQRLHEALKKAGVKEKLEVVDGAGHGWGGELKARTSKEALEFFDEQLKGVKK